MKLRDAQRIVNAEVICGEEFLDREVSCASSADMMSDVLAFSKENCIVITGLVNAQVVRTAEMSDAVGILFVRGKRPPPETIELAKLNNMPLLTTKHLMYVSCGLLFQAGLEGCYMPDEEENAT
jgi:predicted transcriptional regulator